MSQGTPLRHWSFCSMPLRQSRFLSQSSLITDTSFSSEPTLPSMDTLNWWSMMLTLSAIADVCWAIWARAEAGRLCPDELEVAGSGRPGDIGGPISVDERSSSRMGPEWPSRFWIRLYQCSGSGIGGASCVCSWSPGDETIGWFVSRKSPLVLGGEGKGICSTVPVNILLDLTTNNNNRKGTYRHQGLP